MDICADLRPGLNYLTGYGNGYIAVNGEKLESSVLVLPDRLETPWTAHEVEELDQQDFHHLAKCGAQIVLLGTGQRQHFPAANVLFPLIEAGVGFEVMTTAAACRTYNILADEGRQVAAALLIARW